MNKYERGFFILLEIILVVMVAGASDSPSVSTGAFFGMLGLLIINTIILYIFGGIE